MFASSVLSLHYTNAHTCWFLKHTKLDCKRNTEQYSYNEIGYNEISVILNRLFIPMNTLGISGLNTLMIGYNEEIACTPIAFHCWRIRLYINYHAPITTLHIKTSTIIPVFIKTLFINSSLKSLELYNM